TGETVFSIALPVPAGERPSVIATPAIDGARLFVAYQSLQGDQRVSHRVIAVDLEARAIDERFEPVILHASKPTWDGRAQVEFRPETALSRSALVFGRTRAKGEGLL